MQEQLKHSRNQTSHYQELFVGDHSAREALWRALSAYAEDEEKEGGPRGEIRDVPPPITIFRSIFAYDLAAEMLLPGDTEADYPAFLTGVSEDISAFLLFVKAALNAYTETRPESTWQVEEISAPDIDSAAGRSAAASPSEGDTSASDDA